MKRILALATGGTIASADAGRGLAPALTGDDLLAFVPEAAALCELDVSQVMNIDSTNMDPAGWLTLAGALRDAYDAYDGFVILHGTDTLAYTAAGLSYLTQNLAKPVVLTGSQLPMAAPGTDAGRNVLDAVRVACDDAAHGVLVAFGGAVIAGTRARKVRTRSFNAFESIGLPPLAHVGEDGQVRWREGALDGRAAGAEERGGVGGDSVDCDGAPIFHDKLNPRVQVLFLAPGVNADAIRALRPHADALVVEAFGLGGVPSCGGVADELLAWADAGKVVVLATQCPLEGCDPSVYEVGRAFFNHPGVLVAGDMTREAALAKTMWALAEACEPIGGRGATDELAAASAAASANRQKLASLFAAPIAHDRASDGQRKPDHRSGDDGPREPESWGKSTYERRLASAARQNP